MAKYKVGVYAHCDMNAWEKEKHVSLKRQLRTVHSYISKDPELIVVKEYLDESTGNEDGVFEDMIADIDDGLIDCVAVRDISVIGKTYHYGIDFVQKFCTFNEIRVIVVNTRYDSIVDNVWNQNKQEYFYKTVNQEQIKERLWAIRQGQFYEGKYISGPVPYGYVRIDGKLYIDPETSGIVRNIYERYLHGDSADMIAKDLRDLNVMSPRTYEYFIKTGEITDKYDWKDCTVWRILRSQFYIGDTVHSQYQLDAMAPAPSQKLDKKDWITIPNTHEPIVSRETFNEVQARIKAISDKRLPRNGTAPVYNGPSDNCYKGKIFCGICGKAGSYKKTGNWVVYRCVTIGHAKENCGAHSSHIRDINLAVLDVLKMRYGLGETKVTKELIDKYVHKIFLMAHDIIYVELKDDHLGEIGNGKKK